MSSWNIPLPQKGVICALIEVDLQVKWYNMMYPESYKCT